MNITKTQGINPKHQTKDSSSMSKTQSTKNSEKYQLGLLRYNTMGTVDNNLFKDTIFEKDQNAKNDFVEYLSNMSLQNYMKLSIKLVSTFTDMTLVQHENGNIVQQKSSFKKDVKKEFSSIEGIKNYFQDEIDKLQESSIGENPLEMIELLTDTLNFFKDYQLKVLEREH